MEKSFLQLIREYRTPGVQAQTWMYMWSHTYGPRGNGFKGPSTSSDSATVTITLTMTPLIFLTLWQANGLHTHFARQRKGIRNRVSRFEQTLTGNGLVTEDDIISDCACRKEIVSDEHHSYRR